jgi:hypothetical protein
MTLTVNFQVFMYDSSTEIEVMKQISYSVGPGTATSVGLINVQVMHPYFRL